MTENDVPVVKIEPADPTAPNAAPPTDVAHAAVGLVTIRDRVRWSDVDKMGVMYFGRYVRFAEIAETEFFRAVGFVYDELHAQFGIWLARIRLEIDFRSPAELDDEIVCRAELHKLGAASMHFRFPVDRMSDGKRLADISLVVACLDASTMKSTRIPARLRRDLERFACVPSAIPRRRCRQER